MTAASSTTGATWVAIDVAKLMHQVLIETPDARDKCSLDIFWLKDQSLEDSASLPEPHVLAEEIAVDLRSALEQIESVLTDLQHRALLSNRR